MDFRKKRSQYAHCVPSVNGCHVHECVRVSVGKEWRECKAQALRGWTFNDTPVLWGDSAKCRMTV